MYHKMGCRICYITGYLGSNINFAASDVAIQCVAEFSIIESPHYVIQEPIRISSVTFSQVVV